MSALYHHNGTYKGLILYQPCPAGYCKENTKVLISLGNLDIQCDHNRSGMLCGECIGNYSLVFGSSKCKDCSNIQLTLLLFFAASGLALVAFLSILRVTVATGMINSVIFYANIVQVNNYLIIPSNAKNVLTVFAWLNLDFGLRPVSTMV